MCSKKDEIERCFIDEASGAVTHINSKPSINPDSAITVPGITIINQLSYPMGRIHPRDYPKTDWKGIVLHYTAGWDKFSKDGTIPSSFKTLRKRGLSYHFIITKDGTVHQCVDVGDKAQHGGSYNGTHLGISYVNVGFQRDGIDNPEWPVPSAGAGTYNGKPRRWDPYPELQKKAGLLLMKHLVSIFPTITAEGILPHSAGDSGKSDTGPALDLEHLKKSIFASIGASSWTSWK